MHRVWRQFRPIIRLRRASRALDLVGGTRARLQELVGLHGKHIHIDSAQISTAIDEQLVRISVNPTAVEWFTLLILRAPSAVRAQREMDEHPHGFHDNHARLYELIDFNDAFVSTVLALSKVQRRGFIDSMRVEIARFCKQVGAPMFTDEQLEAITRGLSREVAVYLGALDQGFGAVMTSRSQDAMGVDLVVTDKASGQSLNIDCKTASAYHYRIKDLVEQGRMSEEAAELAEELGYAHELNGHGGEQVAVTLMRVDPNELGDVRDFEFIEPALLGERLKRVFASEIAVV